MKIATTNWQTHLFVSISIVAFLFIAQLEVAAQDIYKVQFKAGDRVEADLNMSGSPDSDYARWRKATVVKVEMWQGLVAGYHIKTDDGLELVTAAKYMRPLSEAQKKEDDKQARPQPKDNDADSDRPVGDGDAGQKRLKFKVGDRVLASPAMLKEDKYYQPCTITSIIPPNAYGVRCDPFHGISFADHLAREDFVRAWTNATPAPTFDCSFDQPPGVNTKTSPASPALFKRIIYEWQAVMNSKTRVGVTFETFQIGKAFKNVYVNTKNALLYEGFPQNATIYPIKTRLVTCVEGSKDYNYRTVWESGYACAKNRFGEWSCGVDGGAPRKVDQQNPPKNQ